MRSLDHRPSWQQAFDEPIPNRDGVAHDRWECQPPRGRKRLLAFFRQDEEGGSANRHNAASEVGIKRSPDHTTGDHYWPTALARYPPLVEGALPKSEGEPATFPRAAELRHELRTPLNQIIGYSEMLLEDAVSTDTELHSQLNEIHAAAYELVKLIQELIPARTERADQTLIDHARDGLCQPVLRLYEAARDLASRPEPFLHPFARHIEAASRELRDFATSAALPQPSGRGSNTPEEHAGAARARLLVADDSDRNREMLCHQLERQGYSVTAVSNGRDALRLLRERAYDLVLLDVMMPELDGFAALESIKSDRTLREIPVIMSRLPTNTAVSSVVSKAAPKITFPSRSIRCCCAPG